MEKFKVLVNVLAIVFYITVFFGATETEMSEGFLMIAGLIELVCITWMVILVNRTKKD
jgi:hypothetical protein